jgi:hypothetical protein
MEGTVKRSEFPRSSVLPHIDYTRRAPLRAVGLFTAVGLASALGYALGLAAAIGLGAMVSSTFARPAQPAPAAVRPVPDPSKFILNALLVPALDPDSDPLRWVDPRPRLRCGPGSVVRVNGAPLRPGEPVPDAPFDLEWWADQCYPFGVAGPRFDGGAKLTVYREDWGFSAMVAPRGLVTVAGGVQTPIERGGASYPQCPDSETACR